MKPAARLNEFGQSAWLDLIGRKLIHSGELSRMVEEDGIRGVTANPAIFEKAIVETDEYDEQLGQLISQEKKPLDIYEAVAVDDVRAGCDLFRPLFDRLQGKDGFVSLEVSPYIARDTRATVEEAKRFWKLVDRSNLFIKIPANPEGIPAIREATASHTANALYTGEREMVAKQIFEQVNESLAKRGITVENVLLRDIQLPATLKASIEAKQQAEQEALAMNFRLQKETQEAQRKRIEAAGVRDFQQIVAQGITPSLLEWKGIEATETLAKSPNTKVVVVGNPKNGLPLILGQ